MGLYSLELWFCFVTFEQAKRESDVRLIPGLFVLVWFGVILFSFVFNCANQADP